MAFDSDDDKVHSTQKLPSEIVFSNKLIHDQLVGKEMTHS